MSEPQSAPSFPQDVSGQESQVASSSTSALPPDPDAAFSDTPSYRNSSVSGPSTAGPITPDEHSLPGSNAFYQTEFATSASSSNPSYPERPAPLSRQGSESFKRRGPSHSPQIPSQSSGQQDGLISPADFDDRGSSRAISSAHRSSLVDVRAAEPLGLGLMPGLETGLSDYREGSASSSTPSYTSDDPYSSHSQSISRKASFPDVDRYRDHKFTPPNSAGPYAAYERLYKAGESGTGARPLTSATPLESKKSFTDSAAYWLILYFIFNLGLTLFNKVVLVSFPFPYTLTGLHALSGCAGCYIALERGAFVPARLTSKENLIMGAFSILYTINIAVSNLSLHLVTVPFHQVVRASTPLFTILISVLIFRGKFSIMKLVSLLPVIAGVGFATYGDYYFTAWGLILTLLGTFLAAFKTVVTNVIQTGGGGRLKLHPLDLLMRMSPLAFIQCVIYGYFSGELERVRRYGAREMTREKAFALMINGMIAFGLNVVSFSANKKTGALTMTVAANCKQVLTIAIAVFLFNLHINVTNGIGIILTLIGGGWYGWIEFQEKNKPRLGRIMKGAP